CLWPSASVSGVRAGAARPGRRCVCHIARLRARRGGPAVRRCRTAGRRGRGGGGGRGGGERRPFPASPLWRRPRPPACAGGGGGCRAGGPAWSARGGKGRGRSRDECRGGRR